MHQDFLGGSDGKASVYNVRDLGSIPGSGKSSGEGNGNPLQYSCLENPMDGGAWGRLLSVGLQRGTTESLHLPMLLNSAGSIHFTCYLMLVRLLMVVGLG